MLRSMKHQASAENDSGDSSSESEGLWIVNFLSKPEHKYLDRIQDSYLQDKFNFYGLKEKIEEFDDAYQVIQNHRPSRNFERESTVYYLAHQRYIYSKGGLENILDKVLNSEFGGCAKIGCKEYPLIPIGLSNEPRKSNTKLYCHSCESLYEPKNNIKRLDGCAWGSSFAHFLILSFPYQFEKVNKDKYVPKCFGFKVEHSDDNDSA
ncbi:casein kinase II subunit beta [Enteropsectra breve]|nr:casein kinase II subunit beta [Enteropsectra breve]